MNFINNYLTAEFYIMAIKPLIELHIKLKFQSREMDRQYEIAQLSYEDERSKSLKLSKQMKYELDKQKKQSVARHKSQTLNEEEQNIDG